MTTTLVSLQTDIICFNCLYSTLDMAIYHYQKHCARLRLRTTYFLIYILDLNPIWKINIQCKYADDLSQLCPQYSPSDLVGEFSHIVRQAEANRLIINRSKTKEIVFRRPSLPPPPLMQIVQVEEAKLLGILLTPTLSMQSHVKYTISKLNQHLYLLNQWAYSSIYGSSCYQVSVRIASAHRSTFS